MLDYIITVSFKDGGEDMVLSFNTFNNLMYIAGVISRQKEVKGVSIKRKDWGEDIYYVNGERVSAWPE